MHAVEDEMLCASLVSDKVPYFNAPVYLQNKSVVGKVDEILGPINEAYFSVKMSEGMVATSFKKGDRIYIGKTRLPLNGQRTNIRMWLSRNPETRSWQRARQPTRSRVRARWQQRR
ncbi:Gar1/Naf1 RNA binding region-domain-containing protein [Boletus edulis BED1]|uniref:H/ACA ribonucleoprotein complex subunit n=1 Tax=Boletus edulis BED1 TaxID=1328754 RepID=A0AAD4BJT1_BOLED|nr:Gar1/Naf1 RNA binding region-domain-containing protein [Boletus edulis BED1]